MERLLYNIITLSLLIQLNNLTIIIIIIFAGELKHVLSLSQPKIIFCSKQTIDKMVTILPQHSYIQKLVLFDNEPYKHPKVVKYQEIVKGRFLHSIYVLS